MRPGRCSKQGILLLEFGMEFCFTITKPLAHTLGKDKVVGTSILNPFAKASFNELGVEISDEQAEKIFTPKEAIEFMKTFLDIHDH